MAKTKSAFPKVIHVVEEGEGTERWLSVNVDGVASLDAPQPVAIYQLVEVGSVRITRQFVTKRSTPR